MKPAPNGRITENIHIAAAIGFSGTRRGLYLALRPHINVSIESLNKQVGRGHLDRDVALVVEKIYPELKAAGLMDLTE